ncbi:MAG: hypothetical protein KA313_08440 [Pseudarcicella sp.]|nr:hypothetical protein [Pseudarcicella sp.]MBP6411111.1 hypothetical protein [Pseudarcicella sp.]
MTIEQIYLNKFQMGITLKTHKKLWGLAASKCAFEDCKDNLTLDTVDNDDYYTVGDEAHIISGKENGPRSYLKYSFPLRQIDKYNNLILLCKKHHKTIDSDEKYYTLESVIEIKKKHEDWVRNNLNFDLKQQKDDELFAEYIDQIELLANFDNWLNWTDDLLGGYYTKIEKQQFNNLIQLHKFICSREFPITKKNITNAIYQFNLVLEDFINKFELYKEERDEDEECYHTRLKYRTGVVTPEMQELHEHILEELIIELTKAGNYLFDEIRQSIFPKFRFEKGNLILNEGQGFAYRQFKYKEGEVYCGFGEIKKRTNNRLDQ